MKNGIYSLEITVKGLDPSLVDRYFKAYSNVDPGDVPAKFLRYVGPTREIILNEARLAVRAACADLAEKTEESLRIMTPEETEAPLRMKGELLCRAMEGAHQAIVYVASVINIDEILKRHPGMMEGYFLEQWAIALLGTVRREISRRMTEEAALTGEKLTSVWSPGQAKTPLQNQQAIFGLLRPEDLGIRLDHNMRMLPLKSVSGMAGIVAMETEESMISCDYCEHGRTCPGYEGKRYAE